MLFENVLKIQIKPCSAVMLSKTLLYYQISKKKEKI